VRFISFSPSLNAEKALSATVLAGDSPSSHLRGVNEWNWREPTSKPTKCADNGGRGKDEAAHAGPVAQRDTTSLAYAAALSLGGQLKAQKVRTSSRHVKTHLIIFRLEIRCIQNLERYVSDNALQVSCFCMICSHANFQVL
jgi:hypothetical protein